MKYESSILKRLIEVYGVVGNPRYISEIIKQFIVQGKECYPNLFTYQADWLAHIDEFGLTPEYTVSYTGQHIYAPNTKEKPVKRAILKGSTKYRDIDTGEVLDAFEDGRNLELVSVEMPVLMTFNRENMFKYFMNNVVSTYTTYSDLKFRKNYGSINVKHVPSPLTFGYTKLVSSVKMGKGTYKFSCKIKVQNIGDTYKVFVNGFYNTNDKVATSLIETIDYVGYVSSNIGDTFMYLYSWNEKQVEYYDIMITKLSNEDISATYVDDYKSNILTVNEDVTLRSNGDNCDELNLLTGQLTQRIGEDGEILTQEVVKRVELTIHDKDHQKVERLTSFEGGTHFTTTSQDGSLLPTLTVDVVTDLEETLKVCSLDGNTL